MKSLGINTIYKLQVIAAAIIALSACDDLLKEEPRNFLSEDIIFSNEEGILAANYGVYESLRDSRYYGRWLPSFLIQTSDVAFGRGSQAPNGNFQWNSVVLERQGLVWSGIYSSINRANVVISKVPEVTVISEDLKNQFMAESLFFRALGYFHLVRLWGDVPLRLEPETDNLAIGRTSSEDVYAQIIEDLQYAEDHLPGSYPVSELGRTTKWAAKALLADVYLTLERWSEAAAKAKEVMDSNVFSLVPVSISEDFNTKIFGIDIPTNSEDIYSIKFTLDLNNDGFVRHFHRPDPGYSFGGPHSIVANLDSWIGKDEWENESSPDLQRNNTLYSGHDTVYLDNNIRMLFRKFRGTTTNVTNSTPILRFAEVLLIFAEAECMANNGPTAAGYEAINKVRRRAYGKAINVPDPQADFPQGMSAAEFREELIMERARELVCEAKRWYDLLRTNTAIEVCKAAGFAAIEERHLKWVIPQAEIDNNDALTQADQNPGW